MMMTLMIILNYMIITATIMILMMMIMATIMKMVMGMMIRMMTRIGNPREGCRGLQGLACFARLGQSCC